MAGEKSLWLSPGKKPIKVDLRERFGDYPYFIDSFDQYVELKIPNRVSVVWKPLGPYLETIDTCDEEETLKTTVWIDTVEAMMERGEDIPPLLLDGDRLFDGRHRGWAAHRLGIKRAPTVDISPFWT
jgi:hypothetical protein